MTDVSDLIIHKGKASTQTNYSSSLSSLYVHVTFVKVRSRFWRMRSVQLRTRLLIKEHHNQIIRPRKPHEFINFYHTGPFPFETTLDL